MPANEQYLRNIKSVHVVFCASMVAFVAATALMLYVDHNDEWVQYQRSFFKTEASLLDRERAEVLLAAGGEDKYLAHLDSLKSDLDTSDAALRTGNVAFAVSNTRVDELKRDHLLKGREVRGKRADRDVARANLDLGVRDSAPESSIAKLTSIFRTQQAAVDELELAWEVLTTDLKAAQATLAGLTVERDRLKDDRKKSSAEITRIEDAISEIAPSSGLKSAKRAFMELPIINGFNGHLRIKQDWLPELRIKLGMASPARFDRCRTCHLGIDRFGAGDVATFPHGKERDGKYSHPFSSHPRPDVFLTAGSPHPIATFGCTVCHDGQGSATSFHNAQHGANDPHQASEWKDKYGHFYNHFWEYPMFPERLRDATCIKCHHDVVELGVNRTFGPTAPKAYEGWQILRQYGCFGCHEVNGFDAKDRIGPDIRLEPTAEEQPKYDADPNLNAGQMRKVGPSLKHVGQKTSAEWLSYWTEEPKRFRPDTRMPQFFGVSTWDNHLGQDLSQVEIAAISHFLVSQSNDVPLLSADLKYEEQFSAPDKRVTQVASGKKLFSERGCLACHSHDAPDFKGISATFGPNLSNVRHKLKPGKQGQDWLYTWIRNPELHHPRTKMPNLFLEPTKNKDGLVTADPAADIVAFLLDGESVEYKAPAFEQSALMDLLKLHLSGKTLTAAQYEGFINSRKFPLRKSQLKGDEVELASEKDTAPSDAEWKSMLLNYVGRRSVSRYGCYGCHDINGYGASRPIGTGLADWGRKDTGRLALEHIEEFLHHHGERDNSSTSKYVGESLRNAGSDTFDSPESKESGLRAAFFYESLAHHGRPGFIFQKLRDPRSYDYKKVETKKYTERLVMPRFPFNDAQIEAVATFVLGLVSDPPASKYLYRPKPQARDIHQGEILLRKYNCVSCHMTDLHEFEYLVDPTELEPTVLADSEHPQGRDALLKWRTPTPVLTGLSKQIGDKTLAIAKLRGMPTLYPDPDDEPEDRQYAFDLWEPVTLHSSAEAAALRSKGLADDQVILPGAKMVVSASKLLNHRRPGSGQFAEWLVDQLMVSTTKGNKSMAWQMVAPPLIREGEKVQTPWLYRFLKEPDQIRYRMALRMPRFNLSDSEAQTLANYFAAKDGTQYPYQELPQTEPNYNQLAATEFLSKHATRASEASYPDESWKMLTATLCIKCHAVGGRPFAAAPNDPNVTQGPNLERVIQRLRPEWVRTWLHNPKWITPYTAMPLPFPRGKVDHLPLFEGDAGDQTVGVYDALMNYHSLLERQPRSVPLAAPPIQPDAK